MSETTPFVNCADHLAQGDIFALRLVAPYADQEIRIFRTDSGLHGSEVFRDKEKNGKIFAYDDLITLLQEVPPDQRLAPFEKNTEGYHEMAVVYADLLTFFIVASQTCDISGPEPKPFATVMPIVTLGGYLASEKLPIGLKKEEYDNVEKWDTIVNFLEKNKLAEDLSGVKNDPIALPEKVREIIANWKPSKESQDEREIRNKIREVINKVINNDKLYIYYIPCKEEIGLPEGFVDFCRLYTMPTETLYELREKRIATINSPYREQFSTKLGTYLSRIATPIPISPPKI